MGLNHKQMYIKSKINKVLDLMFEDLDIANYFKYEKVYKKLVLEFMLAGVENKIYGYYFYIEDDRIKGKMKPWYKRRLERLK